MQSSLRIFRLLSNIWLLLVVVLELLMPQAVEEQEDFALHHHSQ
jgi:hypothetical protein